MQHKDIHFITNSTRIAQPVVAFRELRVTVRQPSNTRESHGQNVIITTVSSRMLKKGSVDR